jgi:hypothetical protein
MELCALNIVKVTATITVARFFSNPVFLQSVKQMSGMKRILVFKERRHIDVTLTLTDRLPKEM